MKNCRDAPLADRLGSFRNMIVYSSLPFKRKKKSSTSSLSFFLGVEYQWQNIWEVKHKIVIDTYRLGVIQIN